MTYNEQRRLAIYREIKIIAEACDRLIKIQDDDRMVDDKVANLDEALGLRRRRKPLADMTMDELARHFGGC